MKTLLDKMMELHQEMQYAWMRYETALKKAKVKVCDPESCIKLDGVSIFYNPCKECNTKPLTTDT